MSTNACTEHFDPEELRNLKSRESMLALLSHYASPQGESGGVPRFTCPFHDHKHPSKPHLRIETARDGHAQAICDSYGFIGDAFRVVQELEGARDFPEQVRAVARITGYPLRDEKGPHRSRPKRARLPQGTPHPAPAPAVRPATPADAEPAEPWLPPAEEEAAFAALARLQEAPEERLAPFAEELGLPLAALRLHSRGLHARSGLLGLSPEGRLLYIYACPVDLLRAGDGRDVRIIMTKERGRRGEQPRFRCHGRKLALWGMGAIPGADAVIITEGESDALAVQASLEAWQARCAAAELCHRLCVVAKPDAGTFRPEWAELLRGKAVLLVADADEAGQRGAAATEQKLHAAGVSCVQQWQPPTGAKDARDAYRAEAPQELICSILTGGRVGAAPAADEQALAALDELLRRRETLPAPAAEAAPPPVVALGESGAVNMYWSTICRRLYALRINDHTPKHLRRMAAPADYAAWLYPEAGAEWVAENERAIFTAAADALLDATRSAGAFHPERVRACGVWRDAEEPDALIYNTGATCYLVRAGHAPEAVGNVRGRYIYCGGQELPAPAAQPLSDEEGRTLRGFLDARLWAEGTSGELLAGWLVCAVLAGALGFRPQVWVNAPAETGKTTLRDDLERILGPLAICLSGAASTPAGLRQKLQSSALPVLFDEAECNAGARSLSNVEGLLELVRAAATGENARICHGSAEGAHRDYVLRNSFILFSINNILHREADASRFLQLTMRRLRTPAENAARWRQQSAGRELISAPGFTARLVTRLLAACPTLLASVHTLTTRLRGQGFTTRLSELLAALLAGAHALCHMGEMDEEAVEHALIVARLYQRSAETPVDDFVRCLETLCGHTLPWEGSRASIATLCEICATADAGSEQRARAANVLEALGLRWRGELAALQLNPAAAALQDIYRRSDWPTGNIFRTLAGDCAATGREHANAHGVWVSTARIKGHPRKCLFIPYYLIVDP